MRYSNTEVPIASCLALEHISKDCETIGIVPRAYSGNKTEMISIKWILESTKEFHLAIEQIMKTHL